MTFNILAIRETDTADDPLYPLPGEELDSIEPLADDGNWLDPLTAVELNVSEIAVNGPRRLIRVNKMKAAVFISEYRVAIACSKYEKGGGWVPWSLGAIPMAIAANTASKVKVAQRRKGKMLVGHVPYAQLTSVGYRPASGVMQREQLRLSMYDPSYSGYRGLVLDVTLSGNRQPANFLAQQIACWAASVKLQDGTQVSDEERAILEPLLEEPEPLIPQADAFSSYSLVPVGFTPNRSEAS